MNKRVIYEKRTRIAIWLGTLLVANIVFCLFFTYPEYKKVSNVDSQYEAVRLKKKKLQLELNDSRTMLKIVRSNKLGIKDFRDNVLSTKKHRMTALQKEIRTLADKSGIRIENISYGNKIESKSDLVYFSISLPLQGNYNSVRKFINAIESSEYFLMIESVSLKIGNESSDYLVFAIELGTYFKNDFLTGITK